MIRSITRALLPALPFAALLDTIITFSFEAVFLPIVTLHLLSRNRLSVPLPRFVIWSLLYLFWGLVATFIGISFHILDQHADPLPTITRVLELIVVFPLVSSYLSDPQTLRRFFQACLAAGALFAICYISAVLIPLTNNLNFIQFLAGPLVVLTPVAAAAALKRGSLALGVVALALATAIGLSVSRGALAAAVLGSLVSTLVLLKQTRIDARRIAILAGGFLLIAALLMTREHVIGLNSLIDSPSGHDSGRLYAWKIVLIELSDNPVLGRGIGGIRRAFYDGDWMRILHETGWGGLFLAAGALVAAGRMLYSGAPGWLSCGLFGSLCALGLRSIFSSPFLSTSEGGFLLLLICCAVDNNQTSENPISYLPDREPSPISALNSSSPSAFSPQ